MNEQDYRHIFHQITPDPDQVDALCAQVRTPRQTRRDLRLPVAAALCAALILCAANSSAIAAGVQQMLRYVSGIGAVAEPGGLLVQTEPLRLDQGNRTYVVENAALDHSVLTIPVEVLSRDPELSRNGGGRRNQLGLRISVDLDGVPLERIILSDTPIPTNSVLHIPFAPLSDLLYLSQRYGLEGYASGCSSNMTFYLPQENPDGLFTITLEDINTDTSVTGSFRLASPEVVHTAVESRPVGEGVITALADLDGRRVSLYGVLDPERIREDEYLVQVSAWDVWFVDEFGNRYSGVERWSPVTRYRSPEVLLLSEPAGRIVQIEVDNLSYNIASQSPHTEQRYPTYENLHWVIDLPAD